MTRVRIEYFDQNEQFAVCLPKAGSITAALHATGDGTWHLVGLDEPIKYQLKVGEPFKFRLLETTWLLIRSRWEGQEVGESEPTSVFILLVEPKQLPLAEPFRVKNYHHVAWGMCHTI